MAAINVEKMSLSELIELEGDIKKAIALTREREKASLRQQVMELVAKRGFSVNEVLGLGRANGKGSKVAIKYRNPANPAQTWTGRGRQPKWLVAALEAGATIEEFTI